MSLVLSRRPGEAVVIGADVVVRVIEIRGNQVRIAIDAPPNVSVRRDELAPMVTPLTDARASVANPALRADR